MEKEWFASWFDSPYYHILYQNRDEHEAREAIDQLLGALDLGGGAKVLDLACGKGRHARYLAEKGFDVTGLDISESSITYARQFETDHLHFYQHDMRLPFRVNYFDAVVNFFTSFGYFDRDSDHLATIQNVCKNLKTDGLFLLDFFNAHWVQARLVESEQKRVGDIDFYLTRKVEGDYVYKTVDFEEGGIRRTYQERVRLYTLADFEGLFAGACLRTLRVFGNYDLSNFDPLESPRLILIARKTQH